MEEYACGPTVTQRYFTEAVELLGRGKFSVVHRTRRREDGRPVALKKVQVFEMGTSERTECMNEIRLLQSMTHPHIIMYLDCVMERNELTVVMELAEHGDLAGLIREAALTGVALAEAAVLRNFTQIADALKYMHERRVMHRDIKPANVFITSVAPTSCVKLGDLGVGRYFSSKTDMTHSTVGTPYYMSPECIQAGGGGGGYDFKSDTWSLGCLLYELAALRSPFYREKINFYLLGKRITSGTFDPLPGGFSAQLRELVDSLLRVDVAARASAADAYERAVAAAG
jgi:NIMA (never in mitosis gene a)-related kinase